MPDPSHLGSPTLSLWPILLCPQKMVCLIPKWWHPSPGSSFHRKLHSKPPLRRGKLGFVLRGRCQVPSTMCLVQQRRDSGANMDCQCPESSPSCLWLSHSCLSLCFLIYESQLGWFLSLFPVHKLLLLLAWSSENLLELVVKLRGFEGCEGSTSIWGTFRPSQSSGEKKSLWWTFLEDSYPSLPGHKKNQVHRALPTKPTATQLNMVSL